MHAAENKTKGHAHAAFLQKHPDVDRAKDMWIEVAKAHMKKFYLFNSSGQWSIESINKNGIHNIPRWKVYPPETKAEYQRLYALAEARDAFEAP
jgi:hypothetical protein